MDDKQKASERFGVLKPFESTSSLYLLLCNAFNSYKKLIVYHITTYLFFLIQFSWDLRASLYLELSLYLEQIPWSLASSR